MLHIKCFRTRAEVEAIAKQWDEIVRRSWNNSFFMTWTWLSHWLDVYLDDHSLLCLGVYDDENLVALAPFWVETRRQWGVGRLKILRFIGSEEACPDHMDLIIPKSHTYGISRLIWDELYGPLRKEWDIWSYEYVPADSHVFHNIHLLAESDDRCLGLVLRDYTICLYVDLPDSWDKFFASFNSKQRRNIREPVEVAQKLGPLELRFCERPEEVPQFLQILIDLHEKSWQERGAAGSFASPRFSRFHHELAASLVGKKQLFLCSLELSGRPIAAFYGFVYNKAVHFYLPGIDRGAVPGASVIKILLTQCLEAAIQRGCTRFDFLRGFEEYKYAWTDTEQRELAMTIYNRSFAALLCIFHGYVNRFSKQAGKLFLGGQTARIKRWLGKGQRAH